MTSSLKARIFIFLLGVVLVSIYSSHHLLDVSSSSWASRPPARRARIFCYVLTHPKNFDTYARASQEAWAHKCDAHRFISFASNRTGSRLRSRTLQVSVGPLPVLQPGGLYNESYKRLSDKVFRAMKDIYHLHGDYDWYLKSDDNTFVFVDNLRRFLADKNRSAPVSYGYNFKVYVQGGYQSGGAGYVLSNEAFRRVGVELNRNFEFCDRTSGVEDYDVAVCLRALGVVAGNSTDELGRERFHPLHVMDHYTGNFPAWLLEYAQNPVQKGLACCSDSSISFHYMTRNDIRLLGQIVDNSSRPLSFADMLTKFTADWNYTVSSTTTGPRRPDR